MGQGVAGGDTSAISIPRDKHAAGISNLMRALRRSWIPSGGSGAPDAENPTGEAAADVAGLGDLAKKALLPPEATAALRAELLSEGAVDVAELTAEDF